VKPHSTGADPLAEISPRLRELELEVAREIAESFLTASSPLEVYRLALARVTPIVGASFASVFLPDDDDPRLLRMACAHNWPQSSARFLGDLRIRRGRGPTGRAVSLQRPIEVVDVFADEELETWWEPARELGFVSMMSLPLAVEGRVFGAVSFYFERKQAFGEEARALLGVVAHQLATTAERAHLIADLRSSNLRLERENESLLRQIGEVESALERARELERGGRGQEGGDEPVSDRTSGRGAGSR
jgi:GAF domain-containing protein